MSKGFKKFGFETTFNEYSTAQTNDVVFTPDSGKTPFITGYEISTAGANNITVKIGTTTVMKFFFGANGGANVPPVDSYLAKGAADETINVTSSAAVDHAVAFTGYQA